MSLSDPIGDMIARIKNSQARNHKKVDLPSSNFKSKIADILKNEGFIKDFKVLNEQNKIQDNLGLNVNIQNKKNNSGKITILYKNLEQFELISNLLKRN